jgi:hypothetical protein
MEARRPLLSVAIATVAGVGVMVVANQLGHGGDLLSLSEYLAPRGVFYGLGIAIVVLITARAFSTSVKARSWGYLAAAVITGLVGLMVLQWNLAWGTDLFSLEGAWLWPLAIVSLFLAVVSFRSWRRMPGRKSGGPKD